MEREIALAQTGAIRTYRAHKTTGPASDAEKEVGFFLSTEGKAKVRPIDIIETKVK